MEKLIRVIVKFSEKFTEQISRAVAVLVLLLIFFVAGGGVSQNDRWRIDTIEISGANTISNDSIRRLIKEELMGNYFFTYARENSYLYPRKTIQQKLLTEFPRISRVQVARINAHTISVNIIERKPYALWCGEAFISREHISSCWFVDDSGFVFDSAPMFSSGVYMEVYGDIDEINEGEALRGQLPLSRFDPLNILSQYARTKIGEPSRIVLKSEGESEIVIRSSAIYPFMTDVAIRLKDGYDPSVVMKNLQSAIQVQFPSSTNLIAGKSRSSLSIEKKLLYIDMRFGNKIFFGFEE